MSEFSRQGGSVRHKDPDAIEDVIENFKDQVDIVIGFPMGKASSIQYPDGTPLIDVAVYNNYGTFNEDGSEHIPARPFMDIGGLKASIQLKPLIKKLIRAVREGKIPFEQAANILGAKAAAIMKNTIRDLKEPPNAPYTVAKKKSANPLVDTGLLMQSVTWEIRKPEKHVENNE